MSAILEFAVHRGMGARVHVDVTRVTHWQNWPSDHDAPAVLVHLDTGERIRVSNEQSDVARRLVSAKDALLRASAAAAGNTKTVDAIVAKAASAVVRQLSVPESHEALDRDLVMAVCTYVMEQAAQ